MPYAPNTSGRPVRRSAAGNIVPMRGLRPEPNPAVIRFFPDRKHDGENTMVNNDLHTTDYTRYEKPGQPETRIERERISRSDGSGMGIAFLVGGVVVAILVLFWLFNADDTSTVQPAGDATIVIEERSTAPADDATAPVVTPAPVENTAPADTTAPVQNSAPADSAAPAPADSAAPADSTQPSGN